MRTIYAEAELAYEWNQQLTLPELEETLAVLEQRLFSEPPHFSAEEAEGNTVLFYDGLGLDTRGLIAIYLKALQKLGYRTIVVTQEWARDSQPVLHEMLRNSPVEWRYIRRSAGYEQYTRDICRFFEEFKPRHAFFYTIPQDVGAVLAFQHYAGVVRRYQINLTDHAFWLGLHAFDRCIEFRDYGARVSCQYRGVAADKIVLLPFYPLIDRETAFGGFPFDATGKKVVFSGGSLYKTLGKGNLYYQMVGDILRRNEDCVFLYAGAGDDGEMKKLMAAHPGQVFHIPERKDFFQLMKHCILYLSTYPITGGLMTQYAAAAGIIPLTLFDSDDFDSESGFLLNEEKRRVYYTDPGALVEDACRILQDETYRAERTALLHGSLFSEAEFAEGLSLILNGRAAELRINNEPLDMSRFMESYRERFNRWVCAKAILSRRSLKMVLKFPELWGEFPSVLFDHFKK